MEQDLVWWIEHGMARPVLVLSRVVTRADFRR